MLAVSEGTGRMLEEALVALATAGGTAVIQAAGTDVWARVRDRVAEFLGRGENERTRAVLKQLDQTAAELAAERGEDAKHARSRLEAAWRTRFEDLLADLEDDERKLAAELLRELATLAGVDSSSVSAGAGGLAVGGDVDIHAEGGSVAAGVVQGGVHLGNPPRPGAGQS